MTTISKPSLHHSYGSLLSKALASAFLLITWFFVGCGGQQNITLNDGSVLIVKSTPLEAFDFGPKEKTPPQDWIGANEDLTQFAYVRSNGPEGYSVVINGKLLPSKYFDIKSAPVLSPNGNRLAFIAVDPDKKQFLVLDNTEGQRYDEIERPVFSHDGQRVFFQAKRNNKYLIVDNGREGAEYDDVDIYNLAISEDGKRYAYPARKIDRWVVVIDGKETRPWDKIYLGMHFSEILFSPNGQHCAYIAKERDSWYVIVDDQKIEPLGEVGGYYGFSSPLLFYTRDSLSLVYTTFVNGENIRCNGQRLLFGTDFQKIVANISDKRGTVIGLGRFAFSPDGKRSGHMSMSRDVAGQKDVYLDDTLLFSGLAVSIEGFSPDSKHLILSQRKDNATTILVDGKEVRACRGAKKMVYAGTNEVRFPRWNGRHVEIISLIFQ